MEGSEEVIRRWTAVREIHESQNFSWHNVDDMRRLQQPPKKAAYKKLTAAGKAAVILAAAGVGVALGLLVAWVGG